jgi:hypothetical protein
MSRSASASASRPPLAGGNLIGGLGNGYNAAYIRQLHHKGVSLHADVDKLVTEPRAYIAYLEESLDSALAAAARADAYAAKLAAQEERMEAMQKSISSLTDAQRASQAYVEQQGHEAGSAVAQAVVGLNGLSGRFEAQAATLASTVAATSVSEHRLAEHTSRITALEAVAASISADSRALSTRNQELEAFIESNFASMSKKFGDVELRVQQAENRATDSASDARSASRSASKSADMAVAAEAASISARDAMRDAKMYSQTALASIQSSETETRRAAHIAEAADARVQGALLLIHKTLRPAVVGMGGCENIEVEAKDFSSLKTIHEDTGSAIATAVSRALESTLAYVKPFEGRLQSVEANALNLKEIVRENSSSSKADIADLSLNLSGKIETFSSKLRHDMEILGIATKTRVDKCSEGVVEAKERVSAGLAEFRQVLNRLSEEMSEGFERTTKEYSEALVNLSTETRTEIETAIEISKANSQAIEVSRKSAVDSLEALRHEMSNKVNVLQDENSSAVRGLKSWVNEELQNLKREESSNILDMKAEVMSARAEAKLAVEKVSKESALLATNVRADIETLRIEISNSSQSIRDEAKSSKARIEGLISSSAKAAEEALTAARAEIPLQIGALKKKLEDDLSSARAEIPLQIGAMKKKLEENLASARAEIPLQIGAMRQKLEDELASARAEIPLQIGAAKHKLEEELEIMQSKLNSELLSARSEIPLQIGAMQKRIEAALESSQVSSREANQKSLEEAISSVSKQVDIGRGSNEEILSSVSATASDLCERIEKVATAWARWEVKFRNERSAETLSMSNAISLLQRQVREALGLSEDGSEQHVRPAWTDAINDVRKALASHMEMAEAENQHMLLLADGLVTRWQETNDTVGTLSSEVNAISAVTAASAMTSATINKEMNSSSPNSGLTRLSTNELLSLIDAAVQPRAIELMEAHAAGLRASLLADLSLAIRAQISVSHESLRKKEQENVSEKLKEVEERVEFAISKLAEAERTALEGITLMGETIESNTRLVMAEATATATSAVSKAAASSSSSSTSSGPTSLAPSSAPLEAILKGAGAPMSPRSSASLSMFSVSSKMSPARQVPIKNDSRSSNAMFPVSPRSQASEKGALDLLEKLNASPSAAGRIAPQSPLTAAASSAFSRSLAGSSSSSSLSRFGLSETRLEKGFIASPPPLTTTSSSSSGEDSQYFPPRRNSGSVTSRTSRRASIASTGSTAQKRQVYKARPVDVRLSMGLGSTNIELPEYIEDRARELGVYLKTKSGQTSPTK